VYKNTRDGDAEIVLVFTCNSQGFLPIVWFFPIVNIGKSPLYATNTNSNVQLYVIW